MEKHTIIPTIDGVYWYCRPKFKPKAVMIDAENFGKNCYKSFCGWKQAYVDKDAYFLGPIPQPST